VAGLQLLRATRSIAQRHAVAGQRVSVSSRGLGRRRRDSELLVPATARLPDVHGVRQRPRLSQRLPREGAAHRHQLLHIVAGNRRHHGRYSRHAAGCLRRGLC